ncbi:MAG: glycosyltransferase, partial [Planctomycetota bacterium]
RYRRSTSPARLRSYRVLRKRFRALAPDHPVPDVVVAAIPSLEWADAAIDYGRALQVPVVVDVRDLWPDVFPSALPRGFRSVGRLLLTPYARLARRVCQDADALSAISEGHLEWALRLSGRERTSWDKATPLGYEPPKLTEQQFQRELTALRRRGVDPGRPICYFAGALERHHDLVTVIDAARRIQAEGRLDVQFVLCGGGSQLSSLVRAAERVRDVHMLGWVDPPTLQTAARIAQVGLCAYSRGAKMGLGNKAYEYMAGRLALASNLPGELTRLIDEHQCGVHYEAGSSASLAKCLQELYGDRVALERIRDNARNLWRQHYRSRELYARFAERLELLHAKHRVAA